MISYIPPTYGFDYGRPLPQVTPKVWQGYNSRRNAKRRKSRNRKVGRKR